METDLVGHLGGAGAEDGGGELVAGLVDEGAGEVLAVADDDAFGKTGLDSDFVGGGGGGEDKLLDAEVFAVAAVGVGVEVAENAPSSMAREQGPGAGIRLREERGPVRGGRAAW